MVPEGDSRALAVGPGGPESRSEGGQGRSRTADLPLFRGRGGAPVGVSEMLPLTTPTASPSNSHSQIQRSPQASAEEGRTRNGALKRWRALADLLASPAALQGRDLIDRSSRSEPIGGVGRSKRLPRRSRQRGQCLSAGVGAPARVRDRSWWQLAEPRRR
jgi:hypothetical protein